jgi:hypothetical protein
MYTRKFAISAQVGGYDDLLRIERIETKHAISIMGQPMKAWGRLIAEIHPDYKAREQICSLFRIETPACVDEQKYRDETVRAIRQDQIAEWFYVLATRINTLEEMLMNSRPPEND